MPENKLENKPSPGHLLLRLLRQLMEVAISVLPVIGLVVVAYLIGWPQSGELENRLILIARLVSGLFGLLFLLNWFLAERDPNAVSGPGWVLPVLAGLILVSAVLEGPVSFWLQKEVHLSLHMVLLVLILLQQLAAAVLRLVSWLPVIENSLLQRLNPGSILFGTFALLILGGTLLLELPNATTGSLGWLDALFTSASAVCVTGLIVVDTATAFTPLGQGIILLLIQMGAFGIVSLTFFLAVITGQGFSVASRVFIRDLMNLDNLRHLRLALAFLFVVTVVLELAGAGLLYVFWSGSGTPPGELLWASVFHSVSAFCNAGFSIFSAGLMDSSTILNYRVQGVLMFLIVVGGIGFPVIMEVIRKARTRLLVPGARIRISIHSRLVLIMTAILLVGGTILLFLSDTPDKGAAMGSRIWESLFNAVTTRTAGFNISDMAGLSSAATAIFIILMFIGGSPGGFAGGIKTTTYALSMLNLRRILLARREVEVFDRRIDESLCNRAFAVLLFSCLWIFAATTLVLFLEPGLTLLDTLFETVSAFSTVGLSRGITAGLTDPSKLVIILTMFVGRIGVMNFLFSLIIVAPRERPLRLPRERIIIE